MYKPAQTSGELAASSQVVTGQSLLHGVELNPPTIGSASLKIHDSVGASGRVVAFITVAAGQSTLSVQFCIPRQCTPGIYAVLTGNATYVVSFSS